MPCVLRPLFEPEDTRQSGPVPACRHNGCYVKSRPCASIPSWGSCSDDGIAVTSAETHQSVGPPWSFALVAGQTQKTGLPNAETIHGAESGLEHAITYRLFCGASKVVASVARHLDRSGAGVTADQCMMCVRGSRSYVASWE